MWQCAGQETVGPREKDKGVLSPGGGAQGKRDQGSRGSHRSCPTVDSEIAGTRIESSLLSAFLKALEFLPTEEKKKKRRRKP